MKRCLVYQVDAFTKNRFEGNPAGVVSNADGLSVAQMQAIARELNNSETAFILSPTGPDHDIWVRFFTPTTEVPLCGHATISAHYVRAVENQLGSCLIKQRTGAGILPVEVVQQKEDYKIVMTQGSIEISPPLLEQNKKDILAALNLLESDLDVRCPIQIVSAGHSKVIIGIRSRATLNSLTPDMTLLSNISRAIRSMGFFIFTLDSDIDEILTHARMFAPAIGIQEDPVTGNGNGPLGAYLVHNGIVGADNGSFTFLGKQGEAIGRPGLVEVTVDVVAGQPKMVRITGDAVINFKTEMLI
jgi:PhzF family phenazine biosynthesis protein